MPRWGWNGWARVLMGGWLVTTGPAAAQDPPPALQILEDARRGELVLLLGPIDLPARTSHHDLAQLPVETGVIPVDGTIHGFRVEMVDGEGRRVPSAVIHHINLIDPDHQELFLPISRRILAVGNETGDKSMPRFLFGYPLEKGQRVILSTMFHNPTDQTYLGAYLKLVLPFTRSGWLWPLFDVYPFQLDVMFPVGDKSFDLPPGHSQRSFEARPTVAGRILAMGGHLHDYGTSLRFEDVTAGKILWEARPHLDGQGRLQAMPVGKLWPRRGVRVVPEHVYRVTAVYDNPTGGTLVEGGMGVVGGIFLPDAEEAWPAPDLTHPLYVADLKHALRQLEAEGEHGHTGHHRSE